MAQWGPEVEVRTDRPTSARMYDYYLGGKDNFAVDRAAAEHVIAAMGADVIRGGALENRAFLRRVVRYLAQAGVEQFLDLGAGLPTQGNVHEVAQAVNPDAHVVYVDVDPIVLAHGRALLAENRSTTVITADLTDPAAVLERATATGLLDLSRPTAVLMFSVLHFLDDATAAATTAAYREVLVPGGYLALSHLVVPEGGEGAVTEAAEAYRGGLSSGRIRTAADIAPFLGDLAPVDPGLVPTHRWRPAPGDPPGTGWSLGGVARR